MKVQQSENLSLSDGDHYWFKRSTRKKRPVTRDDDDDDDDDDNNNNRLSHHYACHKMVFQLPINLNFTTANPFFLQLFGQ
jgi:hypothetical protein